MTKATPRHTVRQTKPAQETILGGPIMRPYPGVRSVPAKAIQRAVKEIFRERAAEERAKIAKT